MCPHEDVTCCEPSDETGSGKQIVKGRRCRKGKNVAIESIKKILERKNQPLMQDSLFCSADMKFVAREDKIKTEEEAMCTSFPHICLNRTKRVQLSYKAITIHNCQFQNILPKADVQMFMSTSVMSCCTLTECNDIQLKNMVVDRFAKYLLVKDFNLRHKGYKPGLSCYGNSYLISFPPEMKMIFHACAIPFHSTESVSANVIDMILSPADILISVDTSDLKLLYDNMYHNFKLNKSIIFHVRCFIACYMRMTFRSIEENLITKKCIVESDLTVDQNSTNCGKGRNSYMFTLDHLSVFKVILRLFPESESLRPRTNSTNISLKNQRPRSSCTVYLKNERCRDRGNSLLKTHEFKEDESVDLIKAELRQLTELAHPHICAPIEYTVAPVLKKTNSEAANSECDGGENARGLSTEFSSSQDINDHMQGAYCISNDTARAEPSNNNISVDGHSQPYTEQKMSQHSSLNSSRKSADHVNDSQQNETVSQSPASEAHDTSSDVNNILPNPRVDDEELQRFEPLMNVIDKIADGQRVPPQITMQYEMLRFCTLRSFPKENKPYIIRLAQAGFYYANSGDEVVCYCCARRRSNWRETDIPMDVHREMNPNCKFLLRNSEVNIPIKAPVQASTIPRTPAHTNILPENIQPTTRPETNPTTNTSLQPTGHHKDIRNMAVNNVPQNVLLKGAFSSNQRMNCSFDQMHLGSAQARAHGNFVHVDTPGSRLQEHVAVGEGDSEASHVGFDRTSPNGRVCEGTTTGTLAKYPKYASKTVRVTSFNDCGDIVIPPDSLADSGFFYAGFGDCVRCFQCGVGLRHWSEEDDPWIEHSRWSKDCSFVRQMRGQEFVNLVQMAVQYSQNQNENGESQSNATAASNGETRGGEDVENLMHTDAAQSVLEMGYHPNIIRRAIKAIVEVNGQNDLTAAHLMEKIFEIEESDNASNTVQNGEHRQQEEQITQSSHFRHKPTAMNGITSEHRDRNSIETQRTTEAQATSTNEANNSSLSSKPSSVGPSLSTHMSGPESSRETRKSQLLEQKKLKEENEKLKQQSICTKCKQNDVCIVFLPCGHLVTCEECAPTVRYCTMQTCGKYIKGTVRTYLA